MSRSRVIRRIALIGVLFPIPGTEGMRIRERQDVLQDVIDSDDDPDGWRAAGGDRAHGLGEDSISATRASASTTSRRTRGTRTRSRPNRGCVWSSSQRPPTRLTTPDALFEDVMNAIESPAFGPEYGGYGRPESLDRLAERFEEAETVLDAELDELIATDEGDRGFQ